MIDIFSRWYVTKKEDAVFALQYYLMIRFLVSLLISVIMVRSTMNMQDLGYFEISIFVVNALSVFWSQGIKNGLFSYYSTRSDVEQKALLSTSFWILLGLSGVVGLLLYACSSFILYWVADIDYLPSIELIALFFVVSVPLVLVESVLYLRKQPSKLIDYSHWSNVGQLLTILFVAVYEPTLTGYLLGMVVWSMVRMFYLIYLFVQDKSLGLFDVKLASAFLLFSVPLIVNSLLSYGMEIIDGLFVNHYFETEFFPVFRYGARELPFTSLLFSALSTAMIPVLMDKGLNVPRLRERANKLMHIVFPVGIFAMIISPTVFVLVYNEEFRQSALIFNVYLLILVSRVLLPQTYNMALHQHRILLFSTIIEIVANVVLSFWWVRYFGIYGLAMATVVAYLIQKIILIWYNKRYNAINISQYIDVKWFAIYTALMIVSFVSTFKFYS